MPDARCVHNYFLLGIRLGSGFFRPPYVAHRGWLGVYLDVPVDWDEIAAIVRDAYLVVAPPRLRDARAAPPQPRDPAAATTARTSRSVASASSYVEKT